MKHTFKGILVLFIFLAVSLSADAQTRVFRGNAQYLTEQVLHLANHRIYPGYVFDFDQVLYTVLGNEIMEGGSGSEFDLVYTFRDGKLYSGNAMYTSQIAYTLGENGKIYKGDSTFELDVLFTVKNGVIYAGSGTFAGDAIYYIDGPHSAAELFGILLSLDLIR